MFALIILPPIMLYKLYPSQGKGSTASVGIFVVFTSLFTICMVLIIGVNRQELFAALAVYCAVLATFIGNADQGQCCKK